MYENDFVEDSKKNVITISDKDDDEYEEIDDDILD